MPCTSGTGNQVSVKLLILVMMS